MANDCPAAPADKKKYIRELGNILLKEHGKKKHYTPTQVKRAHQSSTWASIDFICWAMSTFCSQESFEAYHVAINETCDYVQMKMEMLQGLSNSANTAQVDIPIADMDASWIDFGVVFEGLFEGIGEFISGIFDGL